MNWPERVILRVETAWERAFARLLLSSQADVTMARIDCGRNCLYAAVERGRGRLEVARVLIAGGAPVDQARTDDSSTPLMAAAALDAKHGAEAGDLCRLLLDAKAIALNTFDTHAYE